LLGHQGEQVEANCQDFSANYRLPKIILKEPAMLYAVSPPFFKLVGATLTLSARYRSLRQHIRKMTVLSDF